MAAEAGAVASAHSAAQVGRATWATLRAVIPGAVFTPVAVLIARRARVFLAAAMVVFGLVGAAGNLLPLGGYL